MIKNYKSLWIGTGTTDDPFRPAGLEFCHYYQSDGGQPVTGQPCNFIAEIAPGKLAAAKAAGITDATTTI